jgi:hypothetical protein
MENGHISAKTKGIALIFGLMRETISITGNKWLYQQNTREESLKLNS